MFRPRPLVSEVKAHTRVVELGEEALVRCGLHGPVGTPAEDAPGRRDVPLPRGAWASLGPVACHHGDFLLNTTSKMNKEKLDPLNRDQQTGWCAAQPVLTYKVLLVHTPVHAGTYRVSRVTQGCFLKGRVAATGTAKLKMFAVSCFTEKACLPCSGGSGGCFLGPPWSSSVASRYHLQR